MQLVAGIVFASVALLIWTVLDLVMSENVRVSRRLKRMTAYEAGQALQAEPLLAPFRQRVLAPAGRAVVGSVGLFGPSGYRERLKERIAAAGSPGGISADRFIIGKVACSLGIAGLVLTIAVLAGWSLGLGALAFIVALVGGFYLPDAWLFSAVQERKTRISRTLPDMLDMLTISVEAGLGFDAALAKLVKNSSGPLAEEFGRMLQEVQAGATRRDALRALVDRTSVTELGTFATALIQADVFGVSIAKVLRAQARELRVRRRQQVEEAAQKVPVKLVFPLILCILPTTILIIMGPAVVRIVQGFGLGG